MEKKELTSIADYLAVCLGTNEQYVPRAASCMTTSNLSLKNGERYVQEETVKCVPIYGTFGDAVCILSFDFTEDDISFNDLIKLMNKYESDTGTYCEKAEKLLAFADDESAVEFVTENLSNLYQPSFELALMPMVFNGDTVIFTVKEPQAWYISSLNNDPQKLPRILNFVYTYDSFVVDTESGVNIESMLNSEEGKVEDAVINTKPDENNFSKALMESEVGIDSFYGNVSEQRSNENKGRKRGVRIGE